VIYLDHNAVTPVRPEAVRAVREALEVFGNPSSVHAAGRAARDLLDGARLETAQAIGAAPGEVVFTSGATESAAIALRGVLAAAAGERRSVVVTAVEHPCVLDLARTLAGQGFPLQIIPVDRQGIPDLEVLQDVVSEETALVCGMLANNETGVVLPISEMVAAARQVGAPFFCDAVQAVGKMDVDVRTLGADLVALSAQKLGGPRGAGALWVDSGVPLAPVFGGHQERGRRAGTENLPGIAGLGAAIAAAGAQREPEQARIAWLRERLEQGLLATVPRTRVNGAGAERLAGTLSVVFEGCDGEALLMALDLEGICASTGSACTSGSTRPSHVLRAMGLSPTDAKATLRLSLGWTTTEAEIELALLRIPPLVERVRREIQM
jgi:cysteine desulfurase